MNRWWKRDPGEPSTGSSADTTYVIGDIHGCYDLLIDLLQRIAVDAENASGSSRLIFLGDYVDRGPNSADVLSSLVWIERHGPLPATFLRGNHDQVMLDYLADPVGNSPWLRIGGAQTLRSYGIIVPFENESEADHLRLRDLLLDSLPVAHLRFLERLRLYHEDDRHVFVHAGIRPGVAMRSQRADDLLWIRDEFLSHDCPGKKPIVHGHSWTGAEPVVRPGRIGVDTGAYQTGVLTAARLRGGDITFLQARSRDQHGRGPEGFGERGRADR